MKKHKVVIIGAGNVATHLGRNLQKAGHEILQVYSRTEHAANKLADELDVPATTKLDAIDKTGTFYLVAVSDHGIDDVILNLKLKDQIVVHTSGSVPLLGMEHISSKHGIFYPSQTFTAGEAVDFEGVPVFIEASDNEVKEELTALAKSMKGRPEYLDSEKRKALHVAAVFVNNFGNFLYGISKDIMEAEKLSYDLLFPLMKETLSKAQRHEPADVQTGPAMRNDFKVIESHLEYLKDKPEFREVYLVLTESILSQNREGGSDSDASEEEDFVTYLL